MSGSGNGYELKIVALHKTARAHDEGATRATDTAAWIETKGHLPASAFGSRSGSAQLAEGYHDLLAQVVSDLNKFSSGLKTGARKLDQAARRYAAVEKTVISELTGGLD